MEKDIQTYIGISDKNRGDVWKKRSDGKYECSKKDFLMEQWEVDYDVQHYFLLLVEAPISHGKIV